MTYKNPITLEEISDRLCRRQASEQDICDRAIALLADHPTALETFAVAIAAELMPIPEFPSPYASEKQRRDRALLELGILRAVIKRSGLHRLHKAKNTPSSRPYLLTVADMSQIAGTACPPHPHSRNRLDRIAAEIESARSPGR